MVSTLLGMILTMALFCSLCQTTRYKEVRVSITQAVPGFSGCVPNIAVSLHLLFPCELEARSCSTTNQKRLSLLNYINAKLNLPTSL